MTSEHALRIYTDMLESGEKIDMAYFQSQLSKDDYNEFQELIPFIALISSTKLSDKFQKTFHKVNEHMETLRKIPSAVDYRARNSADKNKADQLLDQIFDEEFPDEEI